MHLPHKKPFIKIVMYGNYALSTRYVKVTVHNSKKLFTFAFQNDLLTTIKQREYLEFHDSNS